MNAALVLCGGQSRRMGVDKASLPFGDTTLLGHVVECVRPAVDVVLLVAAPDQALPAVPDVSVVRDRLTNRGPLAGMQVGLGALGSDSDAALVTACDVPFITQALILTLFDAGDDDVIACPHDGRRAHPLAAVYPCGVLNTIQTMLASHNDRVTNLLCRFGAHYLDARDEASRKALTNLNTSESYEQARGSLPKNVEER